jgi:CRISPR-associated protein (TIGR02710 family)
VETIPAFSSAFPFLEQIYFLPRPLDLDMPGWELKKAKRLRYIEHGLFCKYLLNGQLEKVDLQGYPTEASAGFLLPLAYAQRRLYQEEEIPRVALDSVSSNSNVYYFNQLRFFPNSGLYCLVRRTDELWPLLQGCWRVLGDEGLGGDRSSGKGLFQVEFPGEMAWGNIACMLTVRPVQALKLALIRKDIGSVRIGIASKQNIRKVDQTPLSWQRSKKQMEQLFGKFNYEGCLRIIDEMSPTVSSGTSEDKYLQFYQLLCKALQAWNRFMHYEAAEYLKPYAGDVPQFKAFLSNIIKSKQDYEKQSLAARAQGDPLPQGVKINLSLVYDLLRNAERCLLKEQEVDAVGRIYRALELMAQLCLLHQNPPINTSGVEVEILPSKLQDKYQKLLDLQANNKGADTERHLQLPLFKAYGLLADLGHPLGRLFQEREKEMENLLKIRNNAIIAHGINPVQAHEARAFYDFTCKFLEDGEKDMNVKGSYSKTLQFPQRLPSLRE